MVRFGFLELAFIWFSRIMGLICSGFFLVTLNLSFPGSWRWLIVSDLEREG